MLGGVGAHDSVFDLAFFGFGGGFAAAELGQGGFFGGEGGAGDFEEVAEARDEGGAGFDTLRDGAFGVGKGFEERGEASSVDWGAGDIG